MTITTLVMESAFEQQIEKIKRLTSAEFCNCRVVFDEDAIPFIRFRIEAPFGVRLSNAYPHLEVEYLEKLSDDELQSFIRALCGRPA